MIPGKLPPRTHIIPPVQGRYSTSPLSVKHTNTRMGGGGVVLPLAQKQRWKCDFFFFVMCYVWSLQGRTFKSVINNRRKKVVYKMFFSPIYPFVSVHPGLGRGGRQPKQRSPQLRAPPPAYQMERYTLSNMPWVHPVAPSQWDMWWDTSPRKRPRHPC